MCACCLYKLCYNIHPIASIKETDIKIASKTVHSVTKYSIPLKSSIYFYIIYVASYSKGYISYENTHII